LHGFPSKKNGGRYLGCKLT